MPSNDQNETLAKLTVTESLYQFAAGIDLKDEALLASVLSENAVSDFRLAAAKAGFVYPVLEGKESLVSALTSSLRPLDTTHSVSNPRATINGSRARLDALVEAQHVLKSDPARYFLMKNRYDVELEKIGENWLITRIIVDNVWRSGDPGVLAGV